MVSLPEDFYAAKRLLYDPAGFVVEELQAEKESPEYGACHFLLNHRKVIFRVAKITPTKPGLFVAIWKRNKSGITAPLDLADEMDYMVISVREGLSFGQFIFPKKVLAEQGVISIQGKKGKRGTRVYPPWSQNLNKQAEKTQQWQTRFFVQVSPGTLAIEQAHQYFDITQHQTNDTLSKRSEPKDQTSNLTPLP